jgi:hypothetical protein
MQMIRLSKPLLGLAACLLLLTGLLAACSSSKHPAVTAVEDYLRALVGKDEARFTGLTCKDFEADALLEYDSFSLVQTRLEGLNCQAQETSASAASVTCQGQIIATYGAEDQQFDLSKRAYQVRKEGSDWLVCGQ